MEGVGDKSDFDPTDGLVYLHDGRCTVCKMHRFAAQPTVIVIVESTLKDVELQDDKIASFLGEDISVYSCILCIELLPYIQANTRCRTKGLEIQDHGPYATRP